MKYLLTPEELQRLQLQMQNPQKRLEILLYVKNIIDEFETWYAQNEYKKESEEKDATLLARLKKFLIT